MSEGRLNEPVAIIGLSCLFPGAATPDEYWHNLIHGLNTTSLATEEQFGADPDVYFDPQRRRHDTTYSLRGGYVRADIPLPDGMDKTAGWSLYVAQQALADGGYLDSADALARCGLILGNLSFPTQESHAMLASVYNPVLERAIAELTGMDDFSLPRAAGSLASENALRSPASVVAQVLGLGAAQFCMDAACASSLYAVGLACAYLNAGQADLMLAGAVSAADPLFVNMGFTHFGAYPEQGESRPLDANSEGLVSGEGAGLLLLKRYSDAVRDGDLIYAVVAGIGLSNDGRGKHPLTPNSTGQILAFQRAYQNGLDPRSVQYIECHASGTPLGDKTELHSMDEYFGALDAAPLIGSVKANQGHLLTAAGHASLLKVILSMQHGEIPATIGVETPLTSQHFGSAQIVRENTLWAQPEKTAGINAFGFGGVSAHIVLQNPEAAKQSSPSVPLPQREGNLGDESRLNKPRLAIVGMDAFFGGCDGLEAYAEAIYDGAQQFRPVSSRRWKGLAEDAPEAAYIESFEIDFLRFKFPPKEDDQPTPQHLLLLKVADNAVQDAGLLQNSNVAVIVVLGTELSLHQYRTRLNLSWQIRQALADHGLALEADAEALERAVKDAVSPLAQANQYTSYIGNIVSSRVSALWDFPGPAFTLSSAENSVYKALEIAQILLADSSLDAVVVGAVDLAAGVENVVVRRAQHPLNTGSATLSFDREVNGWMPGEGAGAVVLKRADRAAGQRVYAMLESITVLQGDDAQTITQAIGDALNAAGVSAPDIGYVEASASGIAAQDSAEAAGLARMYTGAIDPLPTALGSVKSIVGHTGAAAGMASLIKTALCLQRRFIPGTPNWTGPRDSDTWQDSAFYVAPHSRTWFSPPGTPRRAAISGLSEDGTCAHLILSDDGVPPPTEAASAYLKRKSLHLLPLDGDDSGQILGRLQQLSEALESDRLLPALARDTYAAFGGGRYAAVLLARDRETLQREIERAISGIPTAIEQGGDWQTPAGSSFSANPLGASGEVAFVYPGAFNSYPDHGRDWLHLFPSLERLGVLGSEVGDQLAETLLYPRTFAAPDRATVRAQRSRLSNDANAMMESGTVFAMLYTRAMRQLFSMKPAMVFGYSLGEGTMLWSMGVWRDIEDARAVLHGSALFKTRLTGRKDAVREAWGLPAEADDDFWASYVLASTPAEVSEQIATETHAFLTHINTPNEVVIAGEPEVCRRIIERLGCESVRAPFDNVIHNDAILSEFGEFMRMYDMTVNEREDDTRFYSSADYEPLRLERELIMRSLARVCCKRVDFPRLLRRAYRDGARIFVELGPGSTSTRWISDTLRADKAEHLAVSIDALRLDDHTALLRMLSRLVSHRVPLDLSLLYDDRPADDERKRLPRTITLGGSPVPEVILSDSNRQHFANWQGRSGMAHAHSARSQAAEVVPVPVTVDESGHVSALGARLAGLRAMGQSVQAQMQSSPAVPAPLAEAPTRAAPPALLRYTPRPALFDHAALDQFARGSMAACFGPEFALYDHKRTPRIPNTDLMLFTRVVEIDATRLVTKPGSSMVTEYDVPPDEWFYRDNAYPFAPYSMLVEMALQPCGFLSAYMGPTLEFPDIDFYFRNLDGQATLLHDIDLRGRTLTNRVHLTSSTVLQGIIIQKYTFDMQVDGESFFTGSSTFGYFTKESLSSQAGLDLGKSPAVWHVANPNAPLVSLNGQRDPELHRPSWMSVPTGQLAFLDEVLVSADGGSHGQGYVYATKHVQPSDWYFACHFHQDPVMPGSLGLETITQALQAFALRTGLDQGLVSPHFAHVEGQPTAWKFRGQVLGDIPSVNVEVHVTSIRRTPGAVDIRANASLWKDGLRIYEFKDVGVRLVSTPNQREER